MNQLMKNRKLLAHLGAASAVAYGLIVARLIIQNEKVITQAEYLATIVGKNMEHLDEFDRIALTDLGLLRQSKSE